MVFQKSWLRRTAGLDFFLNLQCWVLSSGTEQSFIAIMDSRPIYHTVCPQEVIDFFFSRFVSSNESID